VITLNNQTDAYRGDPFDLIELCQLLKNPHRILYEATSPFQHIQLIESKNIRLYRNQQLIFNSMDESIYYEALVHPSMFLAKRHDQILIIGSEHGLAVREVLKYQGVKQVHLVVLSPTTYQAALNTPEITGLNEGALCDPRVQVYTEEFFRFLNTEQMSFDVIIADFPDPANERLSRYYTVEVFRQLTHKLADQGIFVINALSLEQTPLLYWSILKTLEDVPLKTLQYHVNVPTFGDIGFHLASKNELVWDERRKTDVPNRSLPDDLSDRFSFPAQVLAVKDQAFVHSLECLVFHWFYAASLAKTIPPNGCSVFYELQHRAHSHPVDSTDLIELRHLLSHPNRKLYESETSDDHILVLNSNDIRLYLDKQLQFSSLDEAIYHEALVHPALAMVQKRERILICGGGDGLALREILKYSDVRHVDLVDLDPLMLHMASQIPAMLTLNQYALHDKRVTIHPEDIQKFITQKREAYDVIIVDLPDPGDEQLSRLYTVEFFGQLAPLLSDEGIMVCQAHSPEFAPLVYWSIGLTLKEAGFHPLCYHAYIPSFGDWGFHLAAKKPLLIHHQKITVPHRTLPEDLSTLFFFPPKMLSLRDQSQINTMTRLTLHQLYKQELNSE
jgi:predicted membrane-bound spermidine synthase